jgi:hypothetical protein
MPVLRSIFFTVIAMAVTICSLAGTLWVATIALKASLFPVAVAAVLVEISLTLVFLPIFILGSLTVAAMITAPFIVMIAALKIATLGFVP